MSMEKVLEFNHESYESLCMELREVMTKSKEIEDRKSYLKERVIESSGGARMEYGISVIERSRKGSIDYKSALKGVGMSEDDLELYRRESIEFMEVKVY